MDWGRYDAAWISSTWDYHERPGEFRRWLARASEATRLENPAALVEWNLDKRYLRELEGQGVQVVPTIWADAERAVAAADEAAERGWDPVVVKPAVDLGAMNLRRVRPDEVEGAVASIAEPSLVQPYLPALEREGELSLVYLRGALSYAVRKVPAGGDFRVQAQYGGTYRPADAGAEAERAGERVLAALASIFPGEPAPLYARVDLVRDLDERLCVIELELIEPSLFLDVIGEEAADRFAALLVARSD